MTVQILKYNCWVLKKEQCHKITRTFQCHTNDNRSWACSNVPFIWIQFHQTSILLSLYPVILHMKMSLLPTTPPKPLCQMKVKRICCDIACVLREMENNNIKMDFWWLTETCCYTYSPTDSEEYKTKRSPKCYHQQSAFGAIPLNGCSMLSLQINC